MTKKQADKLIDTIDRLVFIHTEVYGNHGLTILFIAKCLNKIHNTPFTYPFVKDELLPLISINYCGTNCGDIDAYIWYQPRPNTGFCACTTREWYDRRAMCPVELDRLEEDIKNNAFSRTYDAESVTDKEELDEYVSGYENHTPEKDYRDKTWYLIHKK